jgi:hypothetical protein
MDETAAGVAAGSATGAFYEVDFSKPLKGQEKAAIKGGVKGGVSEGLKANKKSETKGGAIDPKGINTTALDTSKRPIIKGGTIAEKLTKKVDMPKLSKKVSKVAREQASIRFDPNLQFAPVTTGGSMKPIEGGSMKPIEGGSMKPIGGSGAKRPAKGSEEAKAWGAKMRVAREAKSNYVY